MKRTLHTRWIALTGIAIAATAVAADNSEALAAQPKSDSWKIVITPRSPVPRSPQVEAANSYWKIYRSLPFIRPLHDVNPMYRHEVTVQILFGFPRSAAGGEGKGASESPPKPQR